MDHSSGSSTVRRGDWSANHSGSSEPTRVAAVRRHRTRDRIVQRDRLRVAVRDDDCGGGERCGGEQHRHDRRDTLRRAKRHTIVNSISRSCCRDSVLSVSASARADGRPMPGDLIATRNCAT